MARNPEQQLDLLDAKFTLPSQQNTREFSESMSLDCA